MNADAPPLEWPTLGHAERRVREIQAKLHRWAGKDSGRRFQDAFNEWALEGDIAACFDEISAEPSGQPGGRPRPSEPAVIGIPS